MPTKQTMTMNKARFHTGTSRFAPTALVVRLMAALKWEIPLGYEDETGFHLGVQAEVNEIKNEIKWPASR